MAGWLQAAYSAGVIITSGEAPRLLDECFVDVECRAHVAAPSEYACSMHHLFAGFKQVLPLGYAQGTVLQG